MNRLQRLLTTIGVLGVATVCSAAHFDYDTTDINASILIREASLLSRHWEANDEIGLFTPGGLCAGGVVVTDFPVGLPAWKDDALTEVVDGFVDGEHIRFTGWDASEQREFPLGEFLPVEGDTVWREDGLMVCELAETGRHFVPQPTFNRHRILCTSAGLHTDAELRSLDDFDEIGLFTPDNRLAGMMIWDAAAHQALGYAFADDTSTHDRVEGFRAGDSIRYMFWLRASAQELEPNRIRITRGDSSYTLHGSSTVELEFSNWAVDFDPTFPTDFVVEGPYPNPFNGRGSISVYLPHEGEIGFTVVDLMGRLVVPERRAHYSGGAHQLSVDFSFLSAGTYLCRINTAKDHRDLRFVLVK